MKHRTLCLCAASALLLMATPRTGVSQDANASYTLQVRVNYTGTGTVDEQHKV
jgi:hypothetical protein